uniref:G-protein coupled receptors family 1 profile domain-containing protein n=1 Tax=Acrobeloides nanus TaxID=290746 RepID=A0A914E3Z5_9BILA
MVPCVLKLGLQCFWNYCFVEGQLGQCFQLIVLCLDCGYDPIVYICVNKRLRFQMRRALGMQTTTTIEVTPFAS